MTRNEELSHKIEQRYDIWLRRVKQFAGEDACDVLNDVLVYLYDHNIVPETDYYVIKSCRHSFFCKNSPYSRKRDKHLQFVELDEVFAVETPEEDLDNIGFVDVWSAIDTTRCSWWEKELFKRKILENKTFQDIADEVGLTLGQVYYSYTKVRNALKKKIR